jgi:hypothetical protein
MRKGEEEKIKKCFKNLNARESPPFFAAEFQKVSCLKNHP